MQHPEEFEGTTRRILRSIESLHRQLLEDLRPVDEMDRLLLNQGYTFDVVFDEEDDAYQLVELNTFGARSACGSCLFQWVQDRPQLHGAEQELYFRVTIPYLSH